MIWSPTQSRHSMLMPRGRHKWLDLSHGRKSDLLKSSPSSPVDCQSWGFRHSSSLEKLSKRNQLTFFPQRCYVQTPFVPCQHAVKRKATKIGPMTEEWGKKEVCPLTMSHQRWYICKQTYTITYFGLVMNGELCWVVVSV